MGIFNFEILLTIFDFTDGDKTPGLEAHTVLFRSVPQAVTTIFWQLQSNRDLRIHQKTQKIQTMKTTKYCRDSFLQVTYQ